MKTASAFLAVFVLVPFMLVGCSQGSGGLISVEDIPVSVELKQSDPLLNLVDCEAADQLASQLLINDLERIARLDLGSIDRYIVFYDGEESEDPLFLTPSGIILAHRVIRLKLERCKLEKTYDAIKSMEPDTIMSLVLLDRSLQNREDLFDIGWQVLVKDWWSGEG